MEKQTYNTVNGKEDAADTLNGTEKLDILRGLGGNDVLDGKSNPGAAVLYKGGEGSKPLFGVFGADYLTGGAGDDTFKRMKADKGITVVVDLDVEHDKFETDFDKKALKIEDTRMGAFVYADEPKYGLLHENGVLFVNTKKDALQKFLSGENALKEVKGDEKDNDLKAPADGRANMLGLGGKDKLTGGGKDDILDGGAGADTLDGGAGDDRLIGGADTGLAALVKSSTGETQLFYSVNGDSMKGGEGRDTFVHKKGNGIDIIEDFKDDFLETDLDISKLKVVDTNKGAFAYYDTPEKFGEAIDLLRNGALFTGMKADDVKKRLGSQKGEKEKIAAERDAKIGASVEQLIGAIASDLGSAGDITGGQVEQALASGLATLA